MGAKSFFKPNKYSVVISLVLALISAVIMYFYPTNRAVCMAIGCPTFSGLALNVALWVFGIVLIVSYLIVNVVRYFTSRTRNTLDA